MPGGLSNFAKDALLGLVVGGTSYSRPATVYAEPYESLPDADGAGGDVPDSGYSGRLAITNNNTNFPGASSKSKALATAQILYTASGAEPLVGVGLWDASTSGNLLALFEPASGLVTSSGKRVKIPAGTLILSSTGAWSTALGNSLLDHLLGGGDYTPAATLYIGLISSGTSELTNDGYARIGKTNNTTNFPEPTDGSTSNGTEIEFGPAEGNWAEATRVGLYDASSGGNLVMVADLDDPVTVLDGETATFDVGELDFVVTDGLA